MKNIGILIAISAFFIFLLFALFLKPLSKSYVVIDGKRFSVDIAATEDQREKGLSIFDKLPSKKGMIFTFDSPGAYSFWMKGMKFPIDIIYINNNKIVDIFPEVPYPQNTTDSPVTVKPTEKANYVLEINAGLSRKYNFKKGDVVDIHL
jgi:uncharacterized protein